MLVSIFIILNKSILERNYFLIFTGSSDVARVFHTLAVAIRSHEEAAMFEFIGN